MTATKVKCMGLVKTGAKCCSRSTNDWVSSMGRLPCLGASLVCIAQTRCQKCARKPTSIPATWLPQARPGTKTRRQNHQSTYVKSINVKTAKLELSSLVPNKSWDHQNLHMTLTLQACQHMYVQLCIVICIYYRFVRVLVSSHLSTL